MGFSTGSPGAVRCRKPMSRRRCAKCGARCSKPMVHSMSPAVSPSRAHSGPLASAEGRRRAVGVEVIKPVTPGQMVVKIVHDQLIETLGASAQPIDLNAPSPIVIMMVGLQGSGKTTTTAKIGKRLAETAKRKVLMASLDTRRPAAMEQLAVLGRQ